MDHRGHQKQQMTSGLTRYRSAPSSCFTSLLSSNNPAGVAGGGGNCGYARDDFDQFLNPRGSNNGIKQVFDRFVANIGPQDSNPDGLMSDSQQINQNPMSNMNVRSDVVAPMKQEHDAQHQQPMNSQFIAPVKQEITQQSSDYSLASQMNYQTQAQQNQNATDFSLAMDSFCRYLDSVDTNRCNQTEMDGGFGVGTSNPNLTRYNSSPAGFFAQVNIENEYGALRGIGSYGTGSGSNAAAEQASFSNPSRFSSQKSGQPNSSGLLAPISELGAKSIEESRQSDEGFGKGHKNDESYMTGFPMPSWDNSQILTDDYLQVPEDDEAGPFTNVNASDNQSSEGRACPPTLLSHLSLPQTSAELSAMEKLLEDSVPCKVRAKRGCATHPRSIAERVRRTRISERMRKLQELVPNMDKQTNTADMLDFAADYIKELETQVKALSETRSKCTCSHK
ncbi:hypothetical protein BC332_16897 [Capsicum chinense]|nr:hypothetical protein BC332_16897 [Capsicum chinense]